MHRDYSQMIRLLIRDSHGKFNIFGVYESLQMSHADVLDADGHTILYYDCNTGGWRDNDTNYYFEWFVEGKINNV